MLTTDEASGEDSGGLPSKSGRFHVRRVKVPSSRILHAKLLHRLLWKVRFEFFECPDHYSAWALKAWWQMRKEWKRAPPDVMITVSKWDSAHVAGLLLHRRFPNVPWIASLSDPWLDMEQFGYVRFMRLSRQVNRWLEASVFGGADLLLFTNDAQRDLCLRRYPPGYAAKARIVPQAYEPELFPDRDREKQRPAERIVLRYVGDFYGPRSPKPLLEALLVLREKMPTCARMLQVEFVGRVEPRIEGECRSLLSQLDMARFVGHVTYQDALRRMVESDVLLVIDAPVASSPFLPSKLIHYLGAGRPILGLTCPGPAWDLVTRANGFVADVLDGAQIVQALGQVCESYRAGSLEERRPGQQVREAFALDRVALDFQDMAVDLVVRRGRQVC